MFSCVLLGANDIEQSKQFYDAIWGILVHTPGIIDPKVAAFTLAMSQLRVAWGATAPHANNMEYPQPIHSAPASFANLNNSSDSASLPCGADPSTLSAACDTRFMLDVIGFHETVEPLIADELAE